MSYLTIYNPLDFSLNIFFYHIQVPSYIWEVSNMKMIFRLALLAILIFADASAYNYRFEPYTKPIPAKYCIVKNCHNCARSFNNDFGTRESRAVCTAMYHQPDCCDFYIKRSKGTLFWVKFCKSSSTCLFIYCFTIWWAFMSLN